MAMCEILASVLLLRLNLSLVLSLSLSLTHLCLFTFNFGSYPARPHPAKANTLESGLCDDSRDRHYCKG